MARAIILNGIGSVGKSSTARALQAMAATPFLHVQGDAFLEMISPQLWDDPDGIIFRQFETGAGPSVEITMGPALDRLMEGMRASVAALLEAGNDCIVDDVMLSPGDQQAYRSRIPEGQFHFVGLHAPLELIEQRERARGDRIRGLARWQWGQVHRAIRYDFELDVSELTPQAAARRIAEALDIPLSHPHGGAGV